MKGQISSVKGSLLPLFSYYTLGKIHPIFSDLQNRIFDFDIAALDMTNLEWSDIFPRSRINLPFVMPFVLLGDIGETKLIREATLKGHISGLPRVVSTLRRGLEPLWSQLNSGRKVALQAPWSQVNLGSIKRLWCLHMPGVARNKGQEGRK